MGRGNPQRLFPGDRIRIGEYEMTVTIENVDDTRESLSNTNHVDPVDIRQRVEAPDPTSYDLVEAHAITGVGIEMYLEDEEASTLQPLHDKYGRGESQGRNATAAPPPEQTREPTREQTPEPTPAPLSLAPDPEPRPRPQPRTQPQPQPRTQPRPQPRTQPRPQPRTQPQAARPTPAPAAKRITRLTGQQGASGDPLETFFRGAGIDVPALSPQQTEQMLMQLGQVTRELIVGVIDCLHLRALQKAQLKQSNTTIQARDNNRLKFSANVEDGFQRLFVDESDEYMSPVESVRAAFADLKGHQRALMAATRKALDEYLDRLEPEQIESRITNGRSGPLINAANKHRYWDLYKDVYSILANRPVDELPQPFLDALAKYYEQATAAAETREPVTKQEAG